MVCTHLCMGGELLEEPGVLEHPLQSQALFGVGLQQAANEVGAVSGQQYAAGAGVVGQG